MDHSFDEFFEQRSQAASDYVKGNPEPLDQIILHQGETSFLSPQGDAVVGGESVAERYYVDAKSFAPEGVTHFEVLQKVSTETMAFWTGYQVARVRMKSEDEFHEMRIRVTEVFQKVNGQWKMIHRHADMPSTHS